MTLQEYLDEAKVADINTYDGFIKIAIANVINKKLEEGWTEQRIIEKIKNHIGE